MVPVKIPVFTPDSVRGMEIVPPPPALDISTTVCFHGRKIRVQVAIHDSDSYGLPNLSIHILLTKSNHLHVYARRY